MKKRYFFALLLLSAALAGLSMSCLYLNDKLESVELKSKEVSKNLGLIINDRLTESETLSNEQLVSVFTAARNDQNGTINFISNTRNIFASFAFWLGVISVVQMVLITVVYVRSSKA